MFKSLKQRYIHYLITRHIKRRKKPNAGMSLSKAEKIGIATALEDIESFNEVIKLKKELERQNKKVSVLGYYPFKAAPEFYKTQMQADVFSTRDLNFLGIPGNVFTKDFLERKYDILIDFSLNEYPPLQYIVTLSQASIKAGRYCKKMVPVYDFLIKKPAGATTANFIEILMAYLSKINTSKI
jgi:hypothetical protein